MTDPLLQMLASLPAAEPDRAGAARVRAAYTAMLARRRVSGPARGARRDGAPAWRPLVAGLGAVYLVASIRLALHLSGLL